MVTGGEVFPVQDGVANGWNLGFLCGTDRCGRGRPVEIQIAEEVVTLQAPAPAEHDRPRDMGIMRRDTVSGKINPWTLYSQAQVAHYLTPIGQVLPL